MNSGIKNKPEKTLSIIALAAFLVLFSCMIIEIYAAVMLFQED
ncbi:hypothetical protein [Anaerobium acetethylicum]|uniref:Uncharacterized protein n=1 Tax=Anaerobium acetethylicum TaxID=1619234 RepID=A0A1D3TRQ2_9FIRM|nr:hypothetical protein [Anaerobium acetethylicum]SCP96432.1 hypothetical protein SAMN05421730_1004189 [Anaerobium acetethylicum]